MATLYSGIEALITMLVTKIRTYRARVTADSGAIRDEKMVKAYMAMCEQNDMANFSFLWFGSAGSKFRTSTIYSYFSKLYSVYLTNDAAQATELSQLYGVGTIAPNERLATLNPNGGTKLAAHTAITFAATDPWSVTDVINWNGNTAGSFNGYCGKVGAGCLGLQISTANILTIVNNLGTVRTNGTYTTSKLIGKTVTLTWVCQSGGGTVRVYVNGVLVDTIVGTTDMVFESISAGRTFYHQGKIFVHGIRPYAITAAQVLTEATYLQSANPSIPTVLIGSQEWVTSNLDVVCTPQGNVINEVTDAANVEQLTNPTFTGSATGWTLGTGIAYGTDNIAATAATATATQTKTLVANKYYKCTVITSGMTGGTLNVLLGGVSGAAISTNATTIQYLKATAANTTAGLNFVGCTGVVESCSIELVGWSGLTEVYDFVYAATAGAAAVKDQAGCLAAAAWCHYNNDSANGAIYGKLYNWYAARTLQYDIDAYNTANPSTPWGYRVPTQTDFTTLQTTLGGSTVAGGKMKKEGLNYWTTPNTGADNSSGFTALMANQRDNLGAFASGIFDIWAYNSVSRAYIENNSAALIIQATAGLIRYGFSIRLIKA